MKLVIVESPTKARALRGFLGRGYRVTASMGHIRDLPRKQLGVDVAHGFRPTYHLRKGGRKILKQLRNALQGASAIYLATDPDREGEAIAWHVLQALDVRDKAVHRVTFHEITPQAVQVALSNPGALDMDLVNAQQARRILDRLVGYQVSPLLWRAIKGPKGLSAGRVQTAALRLVVERDREIEAFVSEAYWTLDAEFSKLNDERRFRARLIRVGPSRKDKPDLKTEADVQRIIEDLAGADYRVLKVERRRRSRRPYPPYTTSTLQQDAANRLHWSADKTMRVAQQLYEGIDLPEEGTVGLITYMRTDSTHVAESAQAEAREVIVHYWGESYAPSRPPQYKTRSKAAQEAHEAIRPTSARRTPRDMRPHLSPDQAQLYELIWRRFIASQMMPAVYNVTTVDVGCARDGRDLPYVFRATGRELIFAGFLKAYEAGDLKASEDEGAAGQELPPLVDGEPLELHGLFPEEHFTRPPSHFTEASLIKRMEKLGIGRPSTYAGVIRTIIKRDYVARRRRKSLEATPLGLIVCDLLLAQFPEHFAIQFTAEMEDDLDRIARGDADWREVLRAFYGPFSQTLEEAEETIRRFHAIQVGKTARRKGKAQQAQILSGETCPACGGRVMLREGKFGRFRSCANFPKCKWSAPVVVGECPACGGDLVERKGKRGVFWGCANYPACRYTQDPQPAEERST